LKVHCKKAPVLLSYLDDIQGAVGLPDAKQIRKGHIQNPTDKHPNDTCMSYDERMAGYAVSDGLKYRPDPVGHGFEHIRT
jgi:hypothetical protein